MKKNALLFLSLLSPIVAQMAPQPLPQVEHLQGQNYLFSWEGVPGRVYFIQTSSTLTAGDFDWEFAPDIRVGTGSQIEMGFQANAENFEFFRVVYTDYSGTLDPNLADFDNDGYTNLEEAIANTNPFDPQSVPASSTGNGTSGQTNNGGTTWIVPWEYQLQYKVDDWDRRNIVNRFYRAGDYYSYDLGEGVNTELNFADIKGVNEVEFLQIEDNPNYNSSDPDSKEWIVIGVVKLNANNPTWSYQAPLGTAGKGYLVHISLKVRQDEGHTGPHGSKSLYETPRPWSGSITEELFSLWENEEAYVTIHRTLGDLVKGAQLPENTIKWSAPDHNDLIDDEEFRVEWPSAGEKEVNLEISGSSRPVNFDIPIVGTMGRANLFLINAVGVWNMSYIWNMGNSVMSQVDARYGTTPGTGGTRQDAIRHSSWNAASASVVPYLNLILATTANEYTGKMDAKAIASNTTMDLNNNKRGAETGQPMLGDFPPLPIPDIIDILEAQYDSDQFFLYKWIRDYETVEPQEASPGKPALPGHRGMLRYSHDKRIFGN